jgi:probable rRNA maturation factor
MILLDPDLEPDAAPRSSAVKQTTAAKLPGLRVPSVRTLVRFLNEAKAVVQLPGQVTVLLTTDNALRSLNRRFRGKNKPTDVLSFPADATAPSAEKITGDLAISIPTASRQAAQQGHTLSTEIKVLMLHGLLHLAGYDHESDSGQMERRERRLRAQLGLPLGLIERAQARRRNALKPAAKAQRP